VVLPALYWMFGEREVRARDAGDELLDEPAAATAAPSRAAPPAPAPA
jgi:hypothetical protein